MRLFFNYHSYCVWSIFQAPAHFVRLGPNDWINYRASRTKDLGEGDIDRINDKYPLKIVQTLEQNCTRRIVMKSTMRTGLTA
jgi:hypothetical protein